MNDIQQRAASILKEQSLFMKGLEVELDEETKKKLAAVGMENAFDDWTKTWSPNEQQQQQQQEQQQQQQRQTDPGYSLHHPSNMPEATTSTPMPGFGTPYFDEMEQPDETPDYLKIATGRATALRSSALQRGMPKRKVINSFSATNSGGGSSGGLKSTFDLKKDIDQLLSRPTPAFQALSTQGSSRVRKLREERSKMRKKSSTGSSGGGNSFGSKTSDPASGGFDFEKLRQAQQYASRFEYTVNEEALTGSSSSGGGQGRAGGSEARSGGGGGRSGGKGRKEGRRRGGSPDVSLRDRYGKSSIKKSSSSLKLKKNRQRSSGGGGGGGGGGGTKTNSVKDANIAQLTANFEQGLELQRLKAELEKSRRSLTESNQFIDTATTQWFKK
jgi:hypothetical protein